MRRSRAISVVATCVTLALVAGCSSSGSTNGSKKSGSSGGASSQQFPVNINAGGTPKRGGTLHMLGTGDVDYMDPNISYYSVGYLGLRMWSRQLLTYPAVVGKTTEVVPDMATQVPTASNGGVTDGGKTIKLTIKKGVKWDTTPARQVTGADLVRGFKRACNPAEPFGGMPDFESLIVGLAQYCAGFAKVDPKSASAIAGYANKNNIAGVSVDPSNPLGVVYKLNTPASYFVDMLAMPVFSPSPKEYDKYIPAGAELAQHTISDGPYKITKYSPTKEIDFARNAAWDPATDSVRKAYVNNVVVNETGNQDTIQTQLQANAPNADMEWDAFPSNTTVPSLLQKKDKNLNVTATFGITPYLVFDSVSPNNGGAMKNVAVRRAVTEAINRQHLTVDLSGSAVSPPLTHVLPAGISGAKDNSSPNPYPYDVKKAKSDLAKAGHKQLTLKILYRSAKADSKAIFLTLQQDFKAAGINVVGQGVPNADFYTKYLQVPSVDKNGTWDIAIASWGPDWYGDAAKSFFAPLLYGNNGGSGTAFPPNGSDYGFYNNAQVNKLTDQASSQASAAAAGKLWQQADKVAMKDAALYPITTPNQPNYHAAHVHNTIPIPAYQVPDPTNVWLSSS
ncbi:ABC transporter substrate-binding protein [uncultured Jatrophihabitans sp.]|uniref:ABC transporter substrate-binding protein n=1 Tax=uncultured Jatrophihabitans sp. TaxID=1610747 RepID=UPI0035CBD0A4